MNLLHVPAGSPWWLFAAAHLVLILHIAGGTVGLVSGAIALLSRKGLRTHRIAGNVFFFAMLVMAAIGATASPFLPVPDMVNVVAATMTIYLVLTGWMSVKRKSIPGHFEKFALATALGIVAAGAVFIAIARQSPTRMLGNTPPQAFYVFMIVGIIGAIGDAGLILRGRMSGPARIARHLWRMCAALTIASGSFFLGQQRVMPAYMHGSPWLFVPVIAPLLAMLFWLVRVRIGSRFKCSPPIFPKPNPQH